VKKLKMRSFVVNSVICPKAEKLNIKHSVHKFKETQVVHSATELNKGRANWPKLHFKTKGDGFGGGSG
jgi:hypothetical protein